MKIDEIDGGITAVEGVSASGIHCGIKKDDIMDLAMIYMDGPCKTAAVYTSNKVKAGFIPVDKKHLENNIAQAIIINSGCANASTGKKGIADAEKITALCAAELGIKPEDVLMASTGHIGDYLPMEKIKKGIGELASTLSPKGGGRAMAAIMTTDSYPKYVAVEIEIGGKKVRIGAICKGAGMIQPNMATMLCFIATDAVIDVDFLQAALKKSVERSFNKITVDGDMSTNDSVFIFATEKAANTQVTFGQGGREFQDALDYVCLKMAKLIVKDGEGATKFVEIKVCGADSTENAVKAARAIANSPLLKCAIYGKDPNWGRLMSAVGASGVYLNPDRIDILFGDMQIVKNGIEIEHNREKLKEIMDEKEIYITLDLNIGEFEDRIWTCDLTHKYVDINMV
jgi:glutamate N-acetyltransferase / amino-acid N-acetyltransferase